MAHGRHDAERGAQEGRSHFGNISGQSSPNPGFEEENHRLPPALPKNRIGLPRGGGGRRERPKRPVRAAGCTRRGEMKWSSPAKPGLAARRGGPSRERRPPPRPKGGPKRSAPPPAAAADKAGERPAPYYPPS